MIHESLTGVVVVGGGPAGSFVAGELARRGVEVALLDREEFPRFHIGESLLPQSMSVLHRAGLWPRITAAGFVRKDGVVFLAHDETHCARFDFADAIPKSEFPHAYQVERKQFDNLLLEWARDQGVKVRTACESVVVESRDREGLVTAVSGDLRIRARFCVDAAGLDSTTGRIRGWAAEPLIKDKGALFGHFRLAKDPLSNISGAVSGDILIVEHDTIWFWVIPLAGGHTSVGFVAPLAALSALPYESNEERFAHVVATFPAIVDRLARSERLSPIRGARSYGRSQTRLYADGLALTGDAAGFLDPVFSSGVCVALQTSEALAKAIALSLSNPALEAEAMAGFESVHRRALRSMGPFVETWYDGALKRVFYFKNKPPQVQAAITSLLAGELWNEANPVVREGAAWVRALDSMIAAQTA